METLTIYDVKRLTKKTSPYFFSKETLETYGQTLKSFAVIQENDTTFLIVAPRYWNGKRTGFTQQIFDTETNKLRSVSFLEI